MAEPKVDGRTRGAKAQKSRRTRRAFGVRRLKMEIDAATLDRLESEQMVPRWVNDENNGQRIRDAIEGGYEFVESQGSEEVGSEQVDADKKIKLTVGTNKDGSPLYAFLMAIPKEFRDEDNAAKERQNKMVDDSIRAGRPNGTQSLGVSSDLASVTAKNINLDR